MFIRLIKRFIVAWLFISIFLACAMMFGFKGNWNGGVTIQEIADGWQWFLFLSGGMAACYLYYTERMRKR